MNRTAFYFSPMHKTFIPLRIPWQAGVSEMRITMLNFNNAHLLLENFPQQSVEQILQCKRSQDQFRAILTSGGVKGVQQPVLLSFESV